MAIMFIDSLSPWVLVGKVLAKSIGITVVMSMMMVDFVSANDIKRKKVR
jgi:hypothetical protein